MAKEEQPLEPAAARALHQVQVELDTRVSISTAPLRPLSTRCMCLDSLCTALIVSLCLGTALVSACKASGLCTALVSAPLWLASAQLFPQSQMGEASSRSGRAFRS